MILALGGGGVPFSFLRTLASATGVSEFSGLCQTKSIPDTAPPELS